MKFIQIQPGVFGRLNHPANVMLTANELQQQQETLRPACTVIIAITYYFNRTQSEALAKA